MAWLSADLETLSRFAARVKQHRLDRGDLAPDRDGVPQPLRLDILVQVAVVLAAFLAVAEGSEAVEHR